MSICCLCIYVGITSAISVCAFVYVDSYEKGDVKQKLKFVSVQQAKGVMFIPIFDTCVLCSSATNIIYK